MRANSFALVLYALACSSLVTSVPVGDEGKKGIVGRSATSTTPKTTSTTASSSRASGTSANLSSSTTGTSSANGAKTTGTSTSGRSSTRTSSTSGAKPTSCVKSRTGEEYDINQKYVVWYDPKSKTEPKVLEHVKALQQQSLRKRTGSSSGGSSCGASKVISVVTEKKYNYYSAYLDEEGFEWAKKQPGVVKVDKVSEIKPEEISVQAGASWGQARISQDKKLTTGAGRETARTWKFPRDSSWGQNVIVYVIDTGVRCSHEQFENRCETGKSIDSEFFTGKGDGNFDVHGHGTMVASVIAGKELGVAQSATIVPIKISDAEGKTDWSHLLDGINLVNKDAAKRQGAKMILNISWTVPQTDEIETLLSVLKNFHNIHTVISAGNEHKNECAKLLKVSTNAEGKPDPLAMMVGGITYEDKHIFNHGPCVDIHAPATNINMAGIKSDQEIVTKSGTSFAAPHVAGVIAAEISKNDRTPDQMRSLLISQYQMAGIQGLPKDTKDRILKFMPADTASLRIAQ